MLTLMKFYAMLLLQNFRYNDYLSQTQKSVFFFSFDSFPRLKLWGVIRQRLSNTNKIKENISKTKY